MAFGRAIGEVKPATAWHRYAGFHRNLLRATHSHRFACFTLFRFASQENERSDTSTKCEVAFGRADKRSQTCHCVAPLRWFYSASLTLRKKHFCFAKSGSLVLLCFASLTRNIFASQKTLRLFSQKPASCYALAPLRLFWAT